MSKLKVINQHIQLTSEERGDNLTNRCLTTDVREKGFYLKAWRAECEFDIDYKGQEDVSINLNDAGSLDLDITLLSKPQSNIFEYAITSKNLTFHYQPELTQEEIDKYDAYRPDNIIGSYAVYHSSKRDNKINPDGSQTNYGTGKAFHIYRPKAIDANGLEVWCELLIKNDKLTVTVPQDYLDKAAYPVIVDPDVGYTTVGGTSYSLVDCHAQRLAANQYTASAGDTITSFSLHYLSYGGACSWEAAAYDTSSNVPVNRLGTAVGDTTAVAAPGSWVTTSAVSNVMTAGSNYTPAYSQVSGTVRVQADTLLGAQSNDTAAGANLPVTWTEASSTNLAVSIYFTYTAGAASTTDTVTIGSDAFISIEMLSDATIGSLDTVTIGSDAFIATEILSDAFIDNPITSDAFITHETITSDAEISGGGDTVTITSGAVISHWFGNNPAGIEAGASGYANGFIIAYGNGFLLPATADDSMITEIRYYVSTSFTDPSIIWGIYDENVSNLPDNLLAVQSGGEVVLNTDGWHYTTLPFGPHTLTPGNRYWVGHLGSTDTSSDIRLRYTGAVDRNFQNDTAYISSTNYPTLKDPFGTPVQSIARGVGVYALYTSVSNITSDAHISSTTVDTVTIGSDAFIDNPITSDAFITHETITSDAEIYAVDTTTIGSDSFIAIEMLSDATVGSFDTTTIGSDAFIDNPITSDAFITYTITSDAIIYSLTQSTRIYSNAQITKESITSDAQIMGTDQYKLSDAVIISAAAASYHIQINQSTDDVTRFT